MIQRWQKMFIFVLTLLPTLLLVQPYMLWPQPLWAQNGGYSRPSSPGASLNSSSGGASYARPPPYATRNYGSSSSGGDRAISRRNSAQALESYRNSHTPSAPSRADQRRPQFDYDRAYRNYAQQYHEVPAGYGSTWGTKGSYPPLPSGYQAGPSRFGAWDAVMLWALLNNVTSSRSRDFFAQNQTDPAYLQWRAEMNQLATNDPQVAAKLTQLDRQLAQNSGAEAAGPNAHASIPAAEADGGYTILIVAIGVAFLVGLWWTRRRAATTATPKVNVPAGISGSAQMRFRVGMTIPLDPTPFILSTNLKKIVPPAEGNLISVEAVGLVSDGASAAGGMTLHRLYLPGGSGFFSLHLGASGQPDECRYFILLDQVTPATAEDWAFWLDPAQGIIGWPEFQAKDGVLYGRVWAAGQARVPPRQQIEALRGLSGDSSRNLQAMLYGRPTGIKPPAPATEYILVEAVEQDGSAWVDIHAGIDINPAALTLPSVAFA
jgi:hypothetical protein